MDVDVITQWVERGLEGLTRITGAGMTWMMVGVQIQMEVQMMCSQILAVSELKG